MASRVNQSNPSNIPTETFRHVRIDPTTGEKTYFYPQEITDAAMRQTARDLGLEIGRTRLGNRVITAVMIPCKDVGLDKHGREIFVDTPSEVQRRRYHEYMKSELAEQDAEKQGSRCLVPDGRGGVRRCPCRTANPDYYPGSDLPKTIAVECSGCVYEDYKRGSAPVAFSALDHRDDGGEAEPFDPAAPDSSYAGDRYMRMRREFLGLVESEMPKLTRLAELMTSEYSLTEAAKELGIPITTARSRNQKLLELAREFLDSTLIP